MSTTSNHHVIKPDETPSLADFEQAEEGVPYPNPINPELNDLYLGAAARTDSTEVTVRIYSSSFRMIRKADCGSMPAGRHPVKVDRKYLRGLANGIYYCVVEILLDNGKREKSKPMEVIVIR